MGLHDVGYVIQNHAALKDLVQSASLYLQAHENDLDLEQSHLGSKILDVAFNVGMFHGILFVNHKRASHDHGMNVDQHGAKMVHPLAVSNVVHGDKEVRYHRERPLPFSR